MEIKEKLKDTEISIINETPSKNFLDESSMHMTPFKDFAAKMARERVEVENLSHHSSSQLSSDEDNDNENNAVFEESNLLNLNIGTQQDMAVLENFKQLQMSDLSQNIDDAKEEAIQVAEEKEKEHSPTKKVKERH